MAAGTGREGGKGGKGAGVGLEFIKERLYGM